MLNFDFRLSGRANTQHRTAETQNMTGKQLQRRFFLRFCDSALSFNSKFEIHNSH
jgi:hypothetical protein